MRIHLFHGFNVSDGGLGSIGNFAPHLEAEGHEVILHDYGWTGPLRLRLRNRKTVRDAIDYIKQGDGLVGHSNGFLICRQIVNQIPERISAVAGIQPCVRRDLVWPSHIRVLCIHNPHDAAVQFGRVWGRLATLTTPWAPHGWGAAGRYGFTTPGQPHVDNWDTWSDSLHEGHRVRGHSNVLRYPAADFWGRMHAAWWSMLGPEFEAVA